MIQFPSKLNVASLPTRIHRLERLTKAWGGAHPIWIKRDDDTGGLISGNKVRKLEFVAKEAMDSGADTLITCGGLQSNHCRATAAVARGMGLDVTLFLRGTEPSVAEGNYFLDKILGAEIHFITKEEYQDRDAIMAAHGERLRVRGKKPFVIAEGASMPMGVWGYIGACKEIVDAEKELGFPFDRIVSASGSGGTSAGIELGTRLLGLRAKPVTVNVCDDDAYFRELIPRLANETASRFGLDVSLSKEEVDIVDGYVGRGYALSRPEELEFIKEVARLEGVVLDPAYTGKAFFGLMNEIKKGRFPEGENILFIHTGGIYGLFPKSGEITF